MSFTQEEKYKIQSVVDLFTSHFNFELNKKTLETLIFQGGMGVDVSGFELGTAVGETGSAGTISTTLSMYKKKLENLDHSLLIGINNLVATVDYEKNYSLGEEMGVDFIASGAGLTVNVAKRAKDQISHLGEKHYWTIPIISNVAQLKKRIPVGWGYMILENTDSGGHNGEGLGSEGTLEEYRHNPVDKGMNKVIYAGGVRTPADFVKVIDHGFDAVQMGTVFLGSIEADFKPQYKEMIINAGEEGIPGVTRVPSVAGLAASGFPIGVIEGVLKGEHYNKYPCADSRTKGCLMNCNNIRISAEKIKLNPEEVGDYCIRQALRAVNNGNKSTYAPLVFSGMHPEKLLLKEWSPDRKPIPAKEIVAKFLIGAYDSIIDGSFKTPGFTGKITDEHRSFLENKFNLYQKNENQTLTAKILQL